MLGFSTSGNDFIEVKMECRLSFQAKLSSATRGQWQPPQYPPLPGRSYTTLNVIYKIYWNIFVEERWYGSLLLLNFSHDFDDTSYVFSNIFMYVFSIFFLVRITRDLSILSAILKEATIDYADQVYHFALYCNNFCFYSGVKIWINQLFLLGYYSFSKLLELNA